MRVGPTRCSSASGAGAGYRWPRGPDPRLLAALREHRHVGFLLVRSAERGPVVLGAGGARYLESGLVEGEDPLAGFPPNTGARLARTGTFKHVADIMVNSFYDSALEEGAAFEELISFHGGVGGPQTRPFLLYPSELPAPSGPVTGAAAVNEILTGWRRLLQDSASELDGRAPAAQSRRAELATAAGGQPSGDGAMD